MNDTILFFTFFVSFLIIVIVGVNTLKSISKHGMLMGNMFFLIITLFYIIVPICYLVFDNHRDSSTLFNRLIARNSGETICICILVCSSIILSMFLLYNYDFKKKKMSLESDEPENFNKIHWKKVFELSKKNIIRCADIFFVLGAISQLVLILSVGGIGKYLALGSLTRGIGKDVSQYLSSSLLPLVTLSNVILVCPFLYKYLMQNDGKSGKLKIKFIVSFILSILFLLYNQGRLPILIFVISFLLDVKIPKKKKIILFFLLVLITFPLLTFLNNFFIYLTYGYWGTSVDNGIISSILLEFTYPFSNFLNRNVLMQKIGFRWGIDLIQWPLFLIPSALLKIVGIAKNSLTNLGSLNTAAYMAIIGTTKTGGIPADFFLFNYAQAGYISLFLGVIVFVRLLRIIDKRLGILQNDSTIKIIIFRICLLLITTINNFDVSVIFRMRTDLVILIIIIFYLYKVHERVLKFEKQEAGE